jgi:UDP-N-acetylglucosamine--N-acetylmuramyl-(pentapeptide) pyrophosphoryl-undecaprenol N-acetylglucosamine transferase
MTKKIIFSAGGTGGHILPAVNLMKHFYSKGYKVLLATDNRGVKFIKDDKRFKSYILRTTTTTNKDYLKNILSLAIIFFSLLKSIVILKKEKPDLVCGFGGYVSFPISFASKLFNIPLVIYENNIIPGRTNRFLAKISKKILTAKNIKKNFPEKFKDKVFKVGEILDKQIINQTILKEKPDQSTLSLLILGGSQGAEIFGKIIPPVIKILKDGGHNVEINQQCIPSQKNMLINFYQKNNIKNNIFEFDKNIFKLILSTDLAISRCGASSMAELVQACTPFIAVPLPNSIDNHQYLNAKYHESNGCCWFMDQKNLNKHNLLNLIVEVISDKKKLKNMCENMKKNHTKDVYNNIENKIIELI